MDLSTPPFGRFVRIIALICLVLGLNDAARLTGVSLGATSPLAVLGPTSFVFLAIFALARLFAAVGLWMKANWGAVLLVAATVVELVVFISGQGVVQMSIFGFIVRLLLAAGVVTILFFSWRVARSRIQD